MYIDRQQLDLFWLETATPGWHHASVQTCSNHALHFRQLGFLARLAAYICP